MTGHAHHHLHKEQHFTATETIRDVVIGMADGLTVPFALAAGLAGAVDGTHLIVVAGLAEVAAGAIAMGLGGYLAARSDAEHYKSEYQREEWEIIHKPDFERQEVVDVFTHLGLSGHVLEEATNTIVADKQRWLDFMMRHELGLEEPDPRRALISALTIGGAYILGGFIPLSAYIFMTDSQSALLCSVAVTGLALAVFGAVKARLTGMPVLRGGLQTLIVGGLAAAAAFTIAKLVGGA